MVYTSVSLALMYHAIVHLCHFLSSMSNSLANVTISPEPLGEPPSPPSRQLTEVEVSTVLLLNQTTFESESSNYKYNRVAVIAAVTSIFFSSCFNFLSILTPKNLFVGYFMPTRLALAHTHK